MSTLSSITNTYGTTSSSSSSSSNSASSLGTDDFLQLLVTQLSNQDPLNPMDDQQFTTQLAQFASLESLQNIESSVTNLSSTIQQQGVLQSVSFIGNDITATGYEIEKTGTDISSLTYTLPSDVSTLVINVYDSNSNLVASKSIGAKAEGDYSWTWDGKDTNGNAMADGTYNIAISAEDADGNSVYATTKVSGTVTGVYTSNGTTYFRLSDGRSVSYSNVTEISGKSTTSDSSDSTSDSSDSTSDSSN